MSKIDDGGSAFPVTPIHTESHGWVHPEQLIHDANGMSLRDYFAAAALTGLIGDFMKSAASNKKNPEESKNHLVAACYNLADGMLEARKGGQS